MNRKIVSKCPFCGDEMCLSRLRCKGCETVIDTEQPIPDFFRLPEDLQEFVMVFLRCRGNIREAEKELGISYPTVCKRRDLVNELLGNQPARVDRLEVLERVERGELTAKEASEILKRKTS